LIEFYRRNGDQLTHKLWSAYARIDDAFTWKRKSESGAGGIWQFDPVYPEVAHEQEK
jgi:hypothetical protein